MSGRSRPRADRGGRDRPSRNRGGRGRRAGPGLPVPPAATIALALAGCVSASGILAERGTGTTRCYRVSYDTLWPAAEAAVRWVGLVVERANRENGFLVGRTYRPPDRPPEEMAVEADQGERVAVVLEGAGPDVWAVEVISKPIFRLDPTPRDWTEPVFETLHRRLPDSARAPHPDLSRCIAGHETPLRPDSARASPGEAGGGPRIRRRPPRPPPGSAAGAHQLGLELPLPL